MSLVNKRPFMTKLPFTLTFITLLILLLTSCTESLGENKSQQEYTFMSFNVWQEGTSVENGLNKIRDVVIETKADVICFSEVQNYENEDWTSKIVNELKASGHDYYRGYAGGDVSIISKFPISSSSLIYEGRGSVAQFDTKFPEQNVVVACAHLH